MTKVVIDGYIVAVSTASAGNTISDAEYNAIMQKIQSKPTDPEGYQYKLRADNLEWEMVELPPAPDADGEADAADYEAALAQLGVNV